MRPAAIAVLHESYRQGVQASRYIAGQIHVAKHRNRRSPAPLAKPMCTKQFEVRARGRTESPKFRAEGSAGHRSLGLYPQMLGVVGKMLVHSGQG